MGNANNFTALGHSSSLITSVRLSHPDWFPEEAGPLPPQPSPSLHAHPLPVTLQCLPLEAEYIPSSPTMEVVRGHVTCFGQ